MKSKLICIAPMGYEATSIGGIPVAFSPRRQPLYFDTDRGEWVGAFSGITLAEHEAEKLLLLGPELPSHR